MFKKTFTYLLIVGLSISLSACDSSTSAIDNEPVIAERVLEIPADPYTGVDGDGRPLSAGVFTYYCLTENKIVPSSEANTTNWDIAFKGTSIIVNGGTSGPGQGAAQVADGLFAEVSSAPESGWLQDSAEGFAVPAGSGQGWYNYDPATHAITPIPGRVLLIRTADGRFAKMSMVNYYKGLPEVPSFDSESRFITFDFVFQPDGSRSFN
ncbi:MAG: hypothetical protein HOE73_02100 [Bacteroidetes Order II. Incertae sedis bacterium]|jgi:hypothetical protein|nr:hypothetical protein [Bacteroidetes Order II. bacterium]MBT4051861.1 hypothetical protein [Bacteroidetes Order II. bacterium]MBT5250085.1 hypothetical protein [Bacteroidetes Order II. bacterium]MBT6200101.1 hypothetical protein [Bacteroidetes Order II. bacterium]MBT6423873.1 hypothetical protein [Bacteroidetes Order II. bacterium]